MSDYNFSNYILAFDEINALTSTSFLIADSDTSTSVRVQRITNDVLSMLIRAYRDGIEAAAQMLNYDLTVSTDAMYQAIFKVIDGKTFETRVAEYVIADDLNGLLVLVESEYHRVFNQAEVDGGHQFQAQRGFGVVKVWVTKRDNRVRDTHAYLEGKSVGLDEEFYTYDGDHATSPGNFLKAENNVHCRCVLLLRLDASQD